VNIISLKIIIISKGK